MTPSDVLTALATARYAQLRTFRRDGTPVDTPIWFVLDADTLVFRTKQGQKTRRIAADPRVELWPCDYRGGYRPGVASVRGAARILDGEAAEAANTALHRRYGWQYNTVPLLKLPGVKNVDHALSLPEKFRRATSKTVWPDSAIVEVKIPRGDGKSVVPEIFSTPVDSPRRV